jgi:ABC-type amino acid transport substrate-binding protein
MSVNPHPLDCMLKFTHPATRFYAAGRFLRGFLLATGALGFLLSTAGLFAADPAIAKGDPLRVGVSPVFPPMVFKQGKELVGVEVDMARELGQYLGRPVVFVEVPWKEQIEALNERRTDIIMSSMSITESRQFVLNFSQPYFVIGQMALVRRDDVNKYLIGFPRDLKGRIAVIPATTGEFLVQRDFPKNKRLDCKDGEAAAQAIIRKKAGLFFSDSTLIWYLAGMHAADGLSVAPVALSEEQLAWGVRKSDDALLAAVNTFITQARKNGTFLKIFRRWTSVGN